MKIKKIVQLLVVAAMFLKPGLSFCWVDSTFFSPKLFIENKGQFDGRDLSGANTIKFGVMKEGVEFYFTPNGLTYRHDEKIGGEEKGGEPEERKPFKIIPHLFGMEWEGANPEVEVISEDPVSYYFTYGDLKDKSGKTSIKAFAYRKIIYKDLYPKIDVEYYFPEGKGGIKYSLILHPGADASLIRMKYSGTENLSSDESGNVKITTPFGNFIDHAPQTFYADNNKQIASSFSVRKNVVSFNLLTPISTLRTIIIDPWTTVPTFSGYNRAYEVDYDLAGNVYIYGGFAQYQEIKMNSAGTIQWVFTPTAFNSSPYPNNYGDCGIDRISGSSYIVEGYNGTVGARIIKVNPSGAQIGMYPGNQQFQEMWRIVYNNCTKQTIIAGGGPQMANQAAILDTNVATLTPINLLSTTETYHDFGLLALDNAGNCFMATVKSVFSMFNLFDNVMVKCPGSTLLPVNYILPDGHTFREDYNYTYVKITTANEAGLGYNGIAVTNNNLYTYDGAVIKRWDKNTMTLKNSAAINNRLFFNAGLEVDDCERIYVGVNKSVVTYDTAFTVLSTIVTPDTVFDLKLGPGNKLYASGIGFVSEFQLTTTPCNTMSISVSASGSCAASSATVTVTGGSAPYTYSWSPGGQTTSVATGLSSGTYTVTVSDATSLCVPGGNIQTATVSITSGALSASVTSTPASCLAGNGSATVTPTGGASPYTYAWSPSGGTNAIASGLAAGNYSVIITDASGCTGTSAVTISSAGGPVVSLSGQTNILCNGMNNGTASVAAGGGTSPYTYSWSPSGGNSSAATGLSAGAYTATVTDATGCSSTQTVTLTQPPAITSSISATPALCGSNNGTATVAAAGGAGTFTYSWSPGGQTSAAVTGLGAGVYSAIVTDGNGCTQTETVAVTSTGGPTAVVSANVTITSGSSATLTASGGGTYVWSNGSIDSVISVSPQVTTVYCVTVSNGLCTDTACVIVYIEPTDCGYSDDQLFVPDAFSPNNDTKNDVLGIYFPNLSCIKDFRFIVYDRWGEKVFESTNVTATWDGTYKGMTMNSAVFVYYMKVTFINGNETVRKGNVSLIR